jgi:hypothetical protein
MNPVKARLCERVEDWPYSSACSRFPLDGVPARYQNLASGAKAQDLDMLPPGLKPRPPKEAEKVGNASGQFTKSANLGPKGPTPNTPGIAPGPKPRPPKEKEFGKRGGV